jgi:hypothetical protein
LVAIPPPPTPRAPLDKNKTARRLPLDLPREDAGEELAKRAQKKISFSMPPQ